MSTAIRIDRLEKNYVVITGTPLSDGTNGAPRTGSETRVKALIVNHFVRIN